mgnify:CR=1 FL=1
MIFVLGFHIDFCSPSFIYCILLFGVQQKGGFIDECGQFQSSGYHYDIAWWEVFNEITMEHGLSIEYYDQIYDAIVANLTTLMPGTKFLGLLLGVGGGGG